MRKISKRIFTVLLTLVMLLAAVPIGAFAQNNSAENGELQIETYAEGANSVGDVLADEIQKVQVEAENKAKSTAGISSLKLDGFTASVNLFTDTTAKLVVAIYTDDGKQMLTSGVVDVTVEETTATVNIKNVTLPDYYLVRAFLLDSATNAVLCDKFTDDTHTKAYIDFMAVEVSDFDRNKVIYFDDNNTDSNFIVISDSAETVNGTESVNVLTSTDYDTNTYVFENIDNTVSSLKVGVIFYFQSDDGQYEIIKVKSIKIDGTTATIISDEMETDEAFKFIRIDSDEFEDEATPADDMMQTQAIEYNPDPKTFFKGKIDIDLRKNSNGRIRPIITANIEVGKEKEELIKEEPEKDSTSIATINTDITMTTVLKVYLSKEYKKVEFTVDGKAITEINAQFTFDETVTLGDFYKGFKKVIVVGVKISLRVKLDVVINITGTLTFTQGVKWSNSEGFERINPPAKFVAEMLVDGTLYVGFEIKPYFNIREGKTANLELPINVGIRMHAVLTASNVASEDHECLACLSGEIFADMSIAATLSLGKDGNYPMEPKTFTAKITDFYYSITFGEFGWTTCPYKKGDSEDDDLIEFGMYPQGEVTDSATLSELNSLPLNWQSYGYYSGNGEVGSMVQSDYMKYADVTYNRDKYRAVIFTAYRPGYTYHKSAKNEQYYNGYFINKIYWFKFEPLKWKLLDDGFMLCETIIDSQPYNNKIYKNGTNIYGEIVYWNNSLYTNYANDYATSSIREWLNNDFYNTAFTAIQKKQIENTILENCAYSSNCSKYDSVSTSDKIFLLSYSDILNTEYGFSSNCLEYDIARRAQGSDYAKCQGLWRNTDSTYINNSAWLLRSAGNNSNIISGVGNRGDTSYHYYCTYFTYEGIRPAMRISNLSALMSVSSSEGEYLGMETFEAEATEVLDITPGTQKSVTAENCLANERYTILNVAGYGKNFELTADNLSYIDVLNADSDGNLITDFIPMFDAENAQTILVGNFERSIEPKDTAVVSEQEGIKYIQGLKEQLTQEQFSDFVTYQNVTLSYEQSSTDCLGTGSTVTVKSDLTGKIIDEHLIVIIGDVNGDGVCDGQDAVLVSCISNGVLIEHDIGEAAFMAADCNHDGTIDDSDVSLLNEAAVFNAMVEQVKTATE